MIFRSLLIQGFKSFVDKTLIEFPSGITAIVGPNGSGKSNIMDALRWVFGEQRASELRGGDMEDVIFAGSEARRASGFAEVGLTLSDLPTEITHKWGTFQDVTVTRKIYRSGEREYFINNRKCRLKDIKDIFFDTGLGARSISIIEQERVTKIVNSSPEELRYFLEETAGVIRYKERKKEAEARLRQTRDNLNRIEDILAVLAGDMQRLSAQVEQVLAYRELRDQKSTFEKAFFCVIYNQYVKERTELDNKLELARDAAMELTGQQQAQINEETALQRERLVLTDMLKDLRKEYERCKDSLAAAEGDIRQYEANIASAAQQREQLAIDIQAADSRIEDMNKRLLALSEAIQDVFDMVSDFEDRVEDYSAELAEHKAMQERIQDENKRHNKRWLEISQRATELSNKINLANAALNNQQAAVARLQREQAEMLDEGGTLDKRIDEAKQQATALEADKDRLVGWQKELETQLTAKEAELQAAAEQQSTMNIALQTAISRIELIEADMEARMSTGASSIIADYDGEPYSKLVKLSEGQYLQYADLYVFQDAHRAAILDRITNEDISLRFIFAADLPTLQNATPLAHISGCLYCEGRIYRAIGGDDPALAILNLEKTLEAEQQKLAKLQTERDKTMEAVQELQAELDEQEALAEANAGRLQEAELEWHTVKNQLGHLEDLKAKIARNASVLDKELALAKQEVASAKQAIAELETKQTQMEHAIAKAEEERAIIEEKTEAITERIEELREEHAAANRELAKYGERKSALQAEKAQLNTDKADAKATQDALKTRLERLADVQVAEWQTLLAEAGERKATSTKAALVFADEIKEAERKLLEADDKLVALRAELAKLRESLHGMDIANTEYVNKRDTIHKNIGEIHMQVQALYNVDINTIYRDIAKDAPSKTRIQEMIANTERSIEELGPLNMAAEAEYEEKGSQLAKQNAQKEDIEKGIDDLNALIGEIDESTAQLFSDTFNAVRQNFVEVFTRFFGSGSAELRLSDPEDLLNTGVELYINPPGKKVNNKNLLSGGEKALAALTFLFALFLQKPTPFCFLDEVDAPLDDANAARFIAMVRSLSDKTQFVIITHKHQTMAAADSLYGVTMQEGGVSAMLSVELM
ncbi:MAG: AAA family ATPase [Deferribacteraceae bacterium]|jgi:chromosome segregation protein|nr:AAA family ATPase [Deferribacteraceae bacterium]